MASAGGEDLVMRARNFVEEYRKHGFFSQVKTPTDLERAVQGVIEKAARGWPEDWLLLSGDPVMFWFDTEWDGDLERMYEEFLDEVSKISGGDLRFANVTSFVDLERDEPSWVEFEARGGRHHIDLESLGDYVDFLGVLRYLNDLLERDGKGRRFVLPFDMGDQTAVIACLSEDAIRWLTETKGWTITDV
jgi:hypothetical protein